MWDTFLLVGLGIQTVIPEKSQLFNSIYQDFDNAASMPATLETRETQSPTVALILTQSCRHIYKPN